MYICRLQNIIMTICPKYKTCAIFNGKAGIEAENIYKKSYCDAGEEKYSICKRFIVSEKTKTAPPIDIMPNSFYSVDEIIEIMREDGLIK